jgi:hypothetical protein
VQLPSSPPFLRNVAQYLEHSAWDREAAGENPAIPTISMLPWPNTRGIRLLSGSMQVRILPAVPLPGGVKVARRFVKPHGVGANPTLAANFARMVGRVVMPRSRKPSEPAGCVGAIPTPSANSKPSTKGKPMKPVLRYQSQLLFRRSFKPFRVMRIRPTGKVNIVFRPVKRFGLKPQLTTVS